MNQAGKEISMLVECEECKSKFEISSVMEADGVGKVTYKREFKVEGKSIFLTYYDCPSCGRRHYVQIDDEVSLSKLKKSKDLFIKLSVAKQKGKGISQKQSDKFQKSRKNLSDYRVKLMKDYTDKSIYDEELKSSFVLRFSV